METVDEGCRELSEEMQSDIALALTNCFLDMSGIETHHCEMNKKQNLKKICVSSMSDRAFSVYTEFYTQTLNMCWFLRGQIWQETISENTMRVGKQLELSAEKQEVLLDIQSKMLRHSKDIESVLSDLSRTAQNHKDTLMILGEAVNDLQSWLIGEVSWINTLVFYVSSAFFFLILTSTKQTIISRLPILTLVVANICCERVLCSFILSRNDLKMNASILYGNVHGYVQILRYCFLIISLSILFYKAYFYEDPILQSKTIMNDIYKQNQIILENLKAQKNLVPDRAYLVYKADSLCNSRLKDGEKSFEDGNSRKYLNNFDYPDSLSSTPSSIRTRATSTKYNLRQRNATPVLD